MSVSILCDESGSPVIDSQGNILLCSGNTQALQTIYNVVSTYKGSEILFPDYGIDFEYINSIQNIGGKAMIIQSMFSEALDPAKLPGIDSIDGISVSIANGVAYVDITFNNSSRYSVSIDVN